MRAFLAPYWRALWPDATPEQVNAMTPSMIAAILGYDLADAAPRPVFDNSIPDVEPPVMVRPPKAAPQPEMRIREVY